MTAWLDENCGADGWAMTPSGIRGVVNDAVSIHFLDARCSSNSWRTAASRTLKQDLTPFDLCRRTAREDCLITSREKLQFSK
jgi:hypothetical protein